MVIINIVGLLLIGLIVWWFWLYKPAEVRAEEGVITVIVEDGAYQPSRISLPAGLPAKICFLRKDASPCAGTVVFADFNISEELPLNKQKEINLPAMTAGNYDFTCQMQMYRGALLVE
ncbi:cupredoxin domain-containing protein [Motiliproteus sp. MSK22-1]|uniref:cupredoxin domain-containing protein n=1 Tax=Motiliproteus sp. MSK22-1 TaxID=1897630 RepID=UPI0009781ED4|nr:cupredoxin domain-containing protein [Motiliproteus sp. MSK22-1]OMH31770.1 plastocyanin [Motiliproteus sp. MSK22-1]